MAKLLLESGRAKYYVYDDLHLFLVQLDLSIQHVVKAIKDRLFGVIIKFQWKLWES